MKKHLLKLFVASALCFCTASHCEPYYDPPVCEHWVPYIEVTNVDNAGMKPFVAAGPVKKEALMLAVRWSYVTTDGAKQRFGHEGRSYFMSGFNKKIYCVTDFSEKHAAGTDITAYFDLTRRFLPSEFDEGFLLMEAPDPGIHSFRVVYTDKKDGTRKAEFVTEPIELY